MSESGRGGFAQVAHRHDHEVVEGEIVAEVEPARKELILLGRAGLTNITHNPDDYVDPEVDRALRDAIPANTVAAMEYQWGRFIWWCGQTRRQHLPATPATLRTYIMAHWEMRRPDGRKRGRNGQPYSPATVEQAVYLISKIHRHWGYVSPVRDPKVELQLKAYRKKFRDGQFQQRKAHALTHDESVAIARAGSLATVAGLRLACASRLQFDTGARAGEILNLLMRDVTWTSDGVAIVHISWSKTQQPRDVAVERVPGVDDDVDPERLLGLWYAARRAADAKPTDFLFVEVEHGGPRKDGTLGGTMTNEPWDYEDYELAFVRAVRRCGVDVDPRTGLSRDVTSHSNRHGMVTAGVNAGIPLEKMASRTGHSPASPVLHGYYQAGTLTGAQNPGTLIRSNRLPRDGER